VSALDTLLLVIAGAPSLPGARCRGRHHLFDPAAPGENPDNVTARHAQALGLCLHCPALAACQSGVADLPLKKRPPGVVAGRPAVGGDDVGRRTGWSSDG
jgi:WhiB family redox-sensing transcriptional regulator